MNVSSRFHRRSTLLSPDEDNSQNISDFQSRRHTFSYGSAEPHVSVDAKPNPETRFVQSQRSSLRVGDTVPVKVTARDSDRRELQNELDNMADIRTSGSTGISNSPDHQEAPINSQPAYYTPHMEDRLKCRLKFFFMAPNEKIKAKKRCPWKLILQIIKIFAVTTQLMQFGYERSSFMDYVEQNTIAMKHLYLKEWNAGYETMPYPPASGAYALYEIPQLYQHINFAMKQFHDTKEKAIASYRFLHSNHDIEPIEMCTRHYKKGNIFENDTWDFDATVVGDCFNIGPLSEKNSTTHKMEYIFDIEKLLNNTNRTIYFDRLLDININLKLKSFRLDINGRRSSPECFSVVGQIIFDNSKHDGQMLVDLETTWSEFDCKRILSKQDTGDQTQIILWSIFDGFVIIISLLSAALCFRSLVRAQKLAKETKIFFKKQLGKTLATGDRLEFLNLWFVVIIINDIMTIIGSSFKLRLENKNIQSSSEILDICGVMLGTGNLLAWLGILRYIGFFKTFNLLIITLKKAFPNVLRFLVCALMLYFGFLFAGWLVLGPYHVKFRHLSTASECLFSLLNGDDMFVTFSATVTKNSLVWYYSRVYLYAFISLYIYVVLSLFIAVIMDTYDTIKHGYDTGFPKSELFQFIEECNVNSCTPLFHENQQNVNLLSCLCFCRRKDDVDHPTEYTSLLNSH